MKVAIVGSRGLFVKDFTPYLPAGTTEIVSGGAKGIDQCAAVYIDPAFCIAHRAGSVFLL